ncbi:hypothetical protein D3C72_1874330 [compost metagenome]
MEIGPLWVRTAVLISSVVFGVRTLSTSMGFIWVTSFTITFASAKAGNAIRTAMVESVMMFMEVS